MEAFLIEGANVSFCARTIRGDEFSLFKGATNGARAVGSAVDISSPEEIKSWVAGAAKEFGRIDSVIANGKLHLIQPLVPMPLACLLIDFFSLIQHLL